MDANPLSENTFYYGDHLDILHHYPPDKSIDLMYLDSPFHSHRSSTVLFKDECGRESEAQIEAFNETWHWNETAEQAEQRFQILALDTV